MNTHAISFKSDTIEDFLPLRERSRKTRISDLLGKASAGLVRLWGTFERSWAASANANTRINELREEAFRQAALAGIC
ncbi:MAG: hypothetical protein JST16_05205 [Bdellovibrionales bacterium]|nr:hypothetical protein [Bdellovibrionales bacterium]